MPGTTYCIQFARDLIAQLGLTTENCWEIRARHRRDQIVGHEASFLLGDDHDAIFDSIDAEVQKLSFQECIDIWYTCAVEMEFAVSASIDLDDKLKGARYLAFGAVHDTIKSLVPAPELPKVEDVSAS